MSSARTRWTVPLTSIVAAGSAVAALASAAASPPANAAPDGFPDLTGFTQFFVVHRHVPRPFRRAAVTVRV
jgi:hypothetical protein